MGFSQLSCIKLINSLRINEEMIRRANVCARKMKSGVGGLSGTGNATHDNNSLGHNFIIADQKVILN
jgi:hypothetical protein